MQCGVCKTAKRDDKGHGPFAVRVGDSWIARFVYRTSETDKAWRDTVGLDLASHAKAVPGERPYLWPHEDSARSTAQQLGGSHVWICDDCTPKEPSSGKRGARRR